MLHSLRSGADQPVGRSFANEVPPHSRDRACGLVSDGAAGNNFKSTFVRARCVATDDPRLKEK
jgi:hypothetical protein